MLCWIGLHRWRVLESVDIPPREIEAGVWTLVLHGRSMPVMWRCRCGRERGADGEQERRIVGRFGEVKRAEVAA